MCHTFNFCLYARCKRRANTQIYTGVSFAGAVVAAVMASEGLPAKEGPLARESAQMAESGDGQDRRARERES